MFYSDSCGFPWRQRPNQWTYESWHIADRCNFYGGMVYANEMHKTTHATRTTGYGKKESRVEGVSREAKEVKGKVDDQPIDRHRRSEIRQGKGGESHQQIVFYSRITWREQDSNKNPWHAWMSSIFFFLTLHIIQQQLAAEEDFDRLPRLIRTWFGYITAAFAG